MAISRSYVVGKRIRERRQELGLSQEDLARLISTNQKQISRYENDQNEPTATVIIELTYALDISADWLLGLSEQMKRSSIVSGLSDVEREAVEIIRAYGPEQQRKLMDFLVLARRFVVGAAPDEAHQG